MYVKHCESAKEMLDTLLNLYYGGKLQISEMKNNAKDSTLIAMTNLVSSQEEDSSTNISQEERTSDSSDDSSIDLEGQQEDINSKD